jgi:nucleoside-diphosphate-sugar epimerase
MSKATGCPYKLAVINPCLIFGPQLPGQPHLNTSLSFIVGFMDGAMKEIDNTCRCVVDVRDCAEAHIAALEREPLSNNECDIVMGRRYLLMGASPHMAEVAELVKNALPLKMKDNVPTKINTTTILPAVNGATPPYPTYFDSSLSTRVLGIKYRSLHDMVVDCVQSCLVNGFDSKNMYDIEKL